jgi:tetratricopeptide (TPR) repeat protein
MRTVQPLAVALLACVFASGANAPKISAPASDPAALMDAGHFKQARKLVDTRALAAPNDAETLYLQARVKAAFGAHEEAIKLAERALQLNARNLYYHGAVAQLYAFKAQTTSNFLEQFTLARKIKGHLDQALALDPRNWQTLDGFVQYYLSAPSLMGGDRNKAQAIADDEVRNDAFHGWLLQARIAEDRHDDGHTEQAYLNALKANPNQYEPLMALATFYLQDGVRKYDLGEKYARQGIAVAPDRSLAYNLLAIAMVHRMRYGADLDAMLAQAEKANPDDLSPYFLAGRTLLQIGQDFDDAERYFKKYLSQEPEGNAPKLAYAHWRLGQLYQKSGKTDAARSEFQAAVQLDPTFEPAKKDLKSVR